MRLVAPEMRVQSVSLVDFGDGGCVAIDAAWTATPERIEGRYDQIKSKQNGREDRADYFTFSRSCIGGYNNGRYPGFRQHVLMISGGKVIEDRRINDSAIIGAKACVKDLDVPGDSTVFGEGLNLVIRGDWRMAVVSHANGVFAYE